MPSTKLTSAEARVGAHTGLDRRHHLQPYQHFMGKIEAAALVTVSIVHFDDDEDYGSGWFASASRDDETRDRYHTAASEWGDGAFEALDRLVAALGFTVDDDGNITRAPAIELAKVA